jgi:dihydrofolate synthase / folylpolyglutamate synthase
MYHRTGPAAYKPGLDNTIELCKIIGNPENKFPSIHIAGTNGKGSTSHLLASILQEAGYKTGLYTSPHLKDFRERVKINGKEISEQYIVNFLKQYQKETEHIKPSFFEWTVALAFKYFVDEKIDIAVIETGLGGRLDSTNVINPLISIITNISNDHAALLGDTLPKIAVEKAGIIKSGIPVVIGESQPEVKSIFEEKSNSQKAPLFFADTDYQFLLKEKTFSNGEFILKFDIEGKKTWKNLQCPLSGNYQQKNFLTVFKAVELLSTKLYINEIAIIKGVSNVIKNTGLMGRWQVLNKIPLAICDTGHNEAGIKLIIEQIIQTPHKQLHFVIGMANDKDICSILKLLPKSAIYYFCKANIPRGMDAATLKKEASKFSLSGEVYASVNDAYRKAKNSASEDDLVFIGGSTFVVAEVV